MSVTHVVLFRPRADLRDDERAALVAALETAAREIPGVRRFEVGRLLPEGPSYQAGSSTTHPFCALVEVDDAEGLSAYLAHPAHVELGRQFNGTLESALIADFETTDATHAASLLIESD